MSKSEQMVEGIKCPKCGNTSLQTLSYVESFVRYSSLLGVGLTKHGPDKMVTLAVDFTHESEDARGEDSLYCNKCGVGFPIPEAIKHIMATDDWEWDQMREEANNDDV
jgi:uncharacterized protein YbaR (Trm112 family)